MENDEVSLYMYGSNAKKSLKQLSKNAAEGDEGDQHTLAYYQWVY